MSGVTTEATTPRVTVVIPTYNYAGVLEYSIGSVLDQSFRDFELIVVGDCCTDESARVVNGFGDPRVSWVNLPKRSGHQVGPNNEGLRRARGTVVAYLGHDDIWLPNHLALLREAFETGVPAAHTSVLHAGPGEMCRITPAPGWSYTRGAWIPPSTLAVLRDTTLAIGGWRDARLTGNLDPENDLVARIFDLVGPPAWVPGVTCVKLAASARRNVYRVQPTHEQAYWLRLIRDSPDPEHAVSLKVGTPYDLAGEEVAPTGWPTRAWRSARFRVRRRLGLSTVLPARTRIRRYQRFKGSR